VIFRITILWDLDIEKNVSEQELLGL